MKHLVLVNQQTGYLMIDIVNAFAQKYDRCTLLTGQVDVLDIPLDESVEVKKLVRYKRENYFYRLLTWGTGFLQAAVFLLFRYRNADVFIVSNPPFAVFLPLLCGNPFKLLIFDVYPDAIVNFRLLSEHSWLIRLWKRLNQYVFQRADRIFTISDGMKSALSYYVPADQIEVVPAWAHQEHLRYIPKTDNIFLKKNGLEKRFIVMYSGNFGYTHNLEALLEVAELDQENPATTYLLVGRGHKKETLKATIAERSLKNCLILPFQSAEMLPHSLSAADIGVVVLSEEAAQVSIPSKFYNLLAVGVPILCITAPDSELAKLVDKLQVGKHFSSSQINEMKAFIEQLRSSEILLDNYRQKARQAARQFTIRNAEKLTV